STVQERGRGKGGISGEHYRRRNGESRKGRLSSVSCSRSFERIIVSVDGERTDDYGNIGFDQKCSHRLAWNRRSSFDGQKKKNIRRNRQQVKRRRSGKRSLRILFRSSREYRP